METKTLGIEVWIWSNILVLFRELDPPDLFRKYGLKQTEFDTLTQLLLSDRPLTQTELTKRLLTTKGSVSQMLTKMERQGFVRREGDPKDRRCQFVILTPKGAEFTRPRLDRHITRIAGFFSSLTELEKEILLKILNKVRKTIVSAGGSHESGAGGGQDR